MEPDLECRTREYPNWACVMSKVNSAQFYCNHNFVHKSHKPCGFVPLCVTTKFMYEWPIYPRRSRTTCLAYSIVTDFTTAIKFGEQCRFWSQSHATLQSSCCCNLFSSTHFPQRHVITLLSPADNAPIYRRLSKSDVLWGSFILLLIEYMQT